MGHGCRGYVAGMLTLESSFPAIHFDWKKRCGGWAAERQILFTIEQQTRLFEALRETRRTNFIIN